MSDSIFTSLLTWQLSQAALRSHRVLHERLAEAGATAYEYRLLSALATARAATQAELGRLARLDRRDVAVTVAGLEASGAVSRSRSPSDARMLVVVLTEAGAARRQELEAVMVAVQEEVFGALTAEERARLTGYLSRLGND